MKRIILIPAYEPDDKLTEFLGELNFFGFEDIVIVDDGSSDRCAGIFADAEKYGTVLVHTENRGKGQALKTGMEYIRRNYDESDIVITADADGQHTPPDIFRVSDEYTDSAMVLGCRDFKGKDIPFRSRFGNRLTAGVFRLVSGAGVKDTQTGLRCFSVSDIPFLTEIEGARYEYEMNMLMKWAESGRRFICTDISTVYIDNNSSSHFRPVLDSLKIYFGIFKFSLSSFAGFITDYTIYSLLLALTGSAVICNISARIVSAAVNFTLNYNFVFDKKEKASRAAVKYFMLAAVILLANTLLLNVLINHAGADPYISKLAVEIIMFAASWFFQKNAVFAEDFRFFRKRSHTPEAGK